MAYKLVIGFIFLILCFLLWIPMNDVLVDVTSVMNNFTNDTDTINRNNTVFLMFNYIMVFIFIVYIIWVLKPSKESQYGYGYA